MSDRRLQLLPELAQAPWYAASPPSTAERRAQLEDERTRLLATAIGDHVPFEILARAREIDERLAALRGP